ncbi:MAG: hypothetical protein WKG00_32500 [Polyangiaceae bacterium]
MGTILRTNHPDLRDLARNSPPLVEAGADRFTGARLVSCLGTGGMSTVFLAQLDPGLRSDDLSPLTPRRFAVKFMQLSTFQQFQRLNQDPGDLFLREVVALSRIAERRPPNEFVVGFYGSGHADIAVPTGDVKRLPWLAIEYVDGGTEGVTLTERVERASGDGIDPIRALRLVRGLFQGVTALHGEGVVHRDLTPDNVLIAGPIDDETPKLSDCGIACVDGMVGTVAGMTSAYGGPEQILSVHGVHNALIGPWTDVHALSAVVWFILGGCDWCRGDADAEWHRGTRGSLRSAPRIHPGFVWDPRALEQLDAVLARAAAPRLPAEALSVRGATETLQAARGFLPILTLGVERFASVAQFHDALLPVLERCAAAWMARAGIENRAATAFRPTQLVRARTGTDELRASIRELPPKNVTEASAPGGAVFQPDGRILCRFGERLHYFIDDHAHKVTVPLEHAARLAASTWLTRGPGGGFALVGPAHVLLVRGALQRHALAGAEGAARSARSRRSSTTAASSASSPRRPTSPTAAPSSGSRWTARAGASRWCCRCPATRAAWPTGPTASWWSARDAAPAPARCSWASTGSRWSTWSASTTGRRCAPRCAAPGARHGQRARAWSCRSTAAQCARSRWRRPTFRWPWASTWWARRGWSPTGTCCAATPTRAAPPGASTTSAPRTSRRSWASASLPRARACSTRVAVGYWSSPATSRAGARAPASPRRRPRSEGSRCASPCSGCARPPRLRDTPSAAGRMSTMFVASSRRDR